MSDEVSGLPPQIQERLVKMQRLQQTLQSILAQKQQVQVESSETEQALGELQKMTDDAVIYKAMGTILVKTERTKMITELTERKDLFSTRVTVLGKQEERLRNQLKDIETQLRRDLNPVSPQP
ncbi:prefoldin subunit beta [Candidatus Bathyarchaeota archaeon]|nr:prefoldin subunit beta [Candidatus Bathyarchaeota archaeon]